LPSSDSYSEVVKYYIAVGKLQVKEKLPEFELAMASAVEKAASTV
jgi:hypothetical protein